MIAASREMSDEPFFCASEVPILASFFLDEAEYRSVFCCLSNWLLAGCPVFSPLRFEFL